MYILSESAFNTLYIEIKHKCYKISFGQNKRYKKHVHCVKSVQIRSYFWPVFSCIRTEYGDLRSKSLYSVRIQENTDQK